MRRRVKPEDTIWLVPKVPDQVDEVMAMAGRLGWTRTGDGEHVDQWKVPGSDTFVFWENDPDTRVEYLAVQGPDRERVATQIADTVTVLGVEDFESHLARSDNINWVMRGLYAVATAAPLRYDPRVARLMDRYMNSSDSLVRRVAVLATAITDWPELVEPVRRFLSDPDVDVRRAAEAALLDLTGER
jgi:hypothetical protein